MPEAASYCVVPRWARASTLASACSMALALSVDDVAAASVVLWAAHAVSSLVYLSRMVGEGA
ncbi:hypothetical protein D3C71_1687710 [compost metagenome]